MQTSFFLGANSKSGFYSLYDNMIDLKDANVVHIIKGSPGCGKSSFMRRINEKLVAKGFDAEEIRCSSDPDSLDAVIFPQLKAALVDGTAPHVVEPQYPLAVEQYIDLGAFADADALRDKKDDIIDAFHAYKSHYTRAYRLTSCAASLAGEILDIALGAVSIERLHKKAAGIISREIKNTRAESGKLIPRFLSGVSPKGYLTLFDTVPTLAERVYVLDDANGLSSFLLQPIQDAALAAGHDVIACYSPLIPERLEHIIIPVLNLAFVTSTKQDPYPFDYYRRLRINAMLDPEKVKAKKQKLVFCRKLYAAMIDEACAALRDAKYAHDYLETYYNPHIHFELVYALADDVTEELLSFAK